MYNVHIFLALSPRTKILNKKWNHTVIENDLIFNSNFQWCSYATKTNPKLIAFHSVIFTRQYGFYCVLRKIPYDWLRLAFYWLICNAHERLADYQLLGLPMEQQLRLTLRMRNIVMPHPCTLPHGKFAQEIQAMIKCTF